MRKWNDSSVFLQFNTHKHTPKKRAPRSRLYCGVKWSRVRMDLAIKLPHHITTTTTPFSFCPAAAAAAGAESCLMRTAAVLSHFKEERTPVYCCCCCSVYYLTPLPPPTPTPTMQVRRSRRLLAPFVRFVSFRFLIQSVSCELRVAFTAPFHITFNCFFQTLKCLSFVQWLNRERK